MPPKWRGTGMSIVNPRSKQIHRKQGVQYEEGKVTVNTKGIHDVHE